jgi:hypothetical protein
MNNLLTILGAALIVFSGIPYIIDVVKKKSRPNIVSWFTWTLLIGIGGFAALDAHEVNTAIITFADAAQCALILGLGFIYGYAKFGWFDAICQAGAIIGLVLWFTFDSPTVAIVAAITIDLIAALPTYRHSWVSPGEETWQTYFISFVGAGLGLIALADFNVNSLAYPLYVTLLGISMAAVIVIRRRKLGLKLFR